MIRIILLASIFWVMPLALTDVVSQSSAVFAAEKEKKKKTRRVPALRESTYKKLAEAQVMIDPESVPREEGEPPPEPTGTPRDAVEMLMKFKDRRGLNSYEKAQIWNTLAFAYYTLEDMKNTIRSYENVLLQGVISEALEQQSLRALYQLYFGEEQYRKAITYIERYEKVRGELEPVVTFTKSLAYYLLEDIRTSLQYAVQVEELALAQGKEMKEPWYYLQVVDYNSLEDYDNVIRVLETLIHKFPKKQYWMHLAGMYSEKEWESKALSAYYAAYHQGFLIRESEVVMLSQRLLASDNPYEAAMVLEKGLDEDVINRNEKNLKLLATAYTMAQEMPKAIVAWGNAAQYAKDGDIYYRLAQALAQEDRYKEAVTAYRKALDKKGLSKEADVQFWLAITLMNLERWNEATRAFRAAERLDRKQRNTVRQYIRYITGEKRRQEELRRMAADTEALLAAD